MPPAAPTPRSPTRWVFRPTPLAKPLLLDYEQVKNHHITVQVTDGDGNSFTKVLKAKGTDVAMEDLTGSAKADKLYGGSNVDTFDGGKGKDTADYADKTKSVEVTLNGSKAVTVEVGGKT